MSRPNVGDISSSPLGAVSSQGIKRDKLKGTNGAKFAVFFRRFSLIFADFRFSWESQHFGRADNRRSWESQHLGRADFRRKPQIFAVSLSLLGKAIHGPMPV